MKSTSLKMKKKKANYVVVAILFAITSTLASFECHYGFCLCCRKAKVQEEEIPFSVRDD